MELPSLVAMADVAHKFTSWMGDTGFTLLAILIGTWILRRIMVAVVSGVLRRAMHLERTFSSDLDREKRMETFIALINAVLSVLVWIIAGMLVLQELGIKTGPLLTGAGVLGVGLAFGAQALMKDFISGLFIVLENQYRVGDEVDLDGTAGTVEHVGIRTTVLRDDEGNVHFVPNGAIQRTTNKSLGFTLLRFSLVTGPVEHSAVKKLAGQVGKNLKHEKKWLPHIDEPLAFREMGKLTERRSEFFITGRVKTAYKDDIAKEYKQQLTEKLLQKGIQPKRFVEKPLESPGEKSATETNENDDKK